MTSKFDITQSNNCTITTSPTTLGTGAPKMENDEQDIQLETTTGFITLAQFREACDAVIEQLQNQAATR